MQLLQQALLCVLAASVLLGAKPIKPQFHQETTDRIIVKYRDKHFLSNTQAASLASLFKSSIQVDASVEPMRLNALGANIVKIRVNGNKPSPDTIARIIAELSKRSDVEYAEPDHIMRPFSVPNDTNYSNSQWDLQNTPGGANLEGAWEITTGSTDDVVAVIDTGILPHAELSGKILDGFDFITDVDMANDLDGRDANATDPGDWCYVGDACYDDYYGEDNSSWHGTHVAGTIAAHSNNASGIAGINWQGKILPVRVLGKGGGYTSDIADGMLWAAGVHINGVPDNTHPAKVLNMSLGGNSTCSNTYQNAIDQINALSSIVVVAAGNSNKDAAFANPASCDGVITVASVARDGGRAYYSNYGAVVEIAAPGGDKYIDTMILSTIDGGTTTPNNDSILSAYQGTSMAAPHISGIVSLITSVLPDADIDVVNYILQQTAKSFPQDANRTCSTELCGAGIVDATAALLMANDPQTSYSPALLIEGYMDRNRNLRYSFSSDTDIVDPLSAWSISGGRLYSNMISDNANTTYAISLDNTDLFDLSFDFDVSSESGYDGLFFYRNLENTLAVSSSTNLLDDYLYYRYDEIRVPATGGTLDMLWMYFKDEATALGADRAWIDNLVINTYVRSRKPVFPKGVYTKLISIVNNGATALTLSDVTLSNTAKFALINECQEPLGYQEQCYMTLNYYGDYNASDETTLSFSTNDPASANVQKRFTMEKPSIAPVLYYLLF